jgi:hypothetical protein
VSVQVQQLALVLRVINDNIEKWVKTCRVDGDDKAIRSDDQPIQTTRAQQGRDAESESPQFGTAPAVVGPQLGTAVIAVADRENDGATAVVPQLTTAPAVAPQPVTATATAIIAVAEDTDEWVDWVEVTISAGTIKTVGRDSYTYHGEDADADDDDEGLDKFELL